MADVVKRALIAVAALLLASATARAQISYGAQSFHLTPTAAAPATPSGHGVFWLNSSNSHVTHTGGGGFDLVDASGLLYASFLSTGANSTGLILDDGSSMSPSLAGQANIAFDSGLGALKVSISTGTFATLLASSNFAFNGLGLDLTAAGTMTLCGTNCNAFVLGNNTVTLATFNVTQAIFQAGGLSKLIWASGLNGGNGAFYSVANGGVNLGQSGNNFGTTFTQTIQNGGAGNTLLLSQAAGTINLWGIVNLVVPNAAANDTAGAAYSWGLQKGGTGTVGKGGKGSNLSWFCGGTGGDGGTGLAPGDGGDCTFHTGAAGVNGTTVNSSSGNFIVDLVAKQGTGVQGNFKVQSAAVDKLIFNPTLLAWYPVLPNTVSDGQNGNEWLATWTNAVKLGGSGNTLTLGTAANTLAFLGTMSFPAGSIASAALASTGVTAATYGDASHVAQVAFNLEGQATSATSVAIAIAESAVTNLTTDLAAKATDSLVLHLAGSETVTGAKTFQSATLLVDNAANTFATTLASAATAARTWTLPDVTDTAVGTTATQTLSAKTFTAPVINGLTSTGSTAINFGGNSGAFTAPTGIFNLSNATVNLVANTVFTGASSATNTTGVAFAGNVADGATSIAYDFNNTTTLATSGALLLRLRNNSATVQFSVDKGGLGIFNSNVESANGVGVFYGASIDRLTTAAVGIGNTNANVVNISRSGQSVGFFGVTAVTRQTSAGNTATTAAGSTTSVFVNTTFTGGSGTTAYTIGDLVLALKNYGLLVL